MKARLFNATYLAAAIIATGGWVWLLYTNMRLPLQAFFRWPLKAIPFRDETPTRARTHLWTPREMQAIFEEDRHVVGCCHLSGL
jgi:hypothetical protein